MSLFDHLAEFPSLGLGHLPTPLERLVRLGDALGCELWVKRDDATGIGFGGNKVRQLNYYLGKARAEGASQVLITGAVQSNFVSMAAAMAAQVGMGCHIQLEDRVKAQPESYHNNGNVLLDELLGATLYSYPEGEDEAGADARLGEIAADLERAGERAFIVPLSAAAPPTGALGYVEAAGELMDQQGAGFDEIFVGSGSALTHCGLLFGLRALGDGTPVTGVCVRRDAVQQTARVRQRLFDLGDLMGLESPVDGRDVRLDDGALGPGYGLMTEATRAAIRQTAQLEGLFLDPVYTGKVMAGLMAQAERLRGKRVLFWHTGGQPALFGYRDAFA